MLRAVVPSMPATATLRPSLPGVASIASAIQVLCRTYRYALYAFVRRQGYNVTDAHDLTQQFFAEFLEKNSLSRADRERGRFRTFLLTSLQNFLGHQWERSQTIKRGGGQTFVPWDEQSPEGRYQLEAATDLTPDRIFEQRWAARFARPVEAARPEKQQPEKPDRPLAALSSKPKDEPTELSRAGLRTAQGGVST